jgi:hypothetical protein
MTRYKRLQFEGVQLDHGLQLKAVGFGSRQKLVEEIHSA